MNRFYLTLVFLCSVITLPAQAMERQITTETITDSREKFSSFLGKKHEEYQQLQSWTDPDSFWGPIISSVIETVSAWTRYGQIEPEKTKAFLGRAFADPDALQQAIVYLSTSEESITYLNTVLRELTEEDLRKKKLGNLAKAMQGKPHPGMPDTQQIATKDERGEYIVPDDQFSLFAATNLFAVFCVEEGLFASSRKHKHPHSQTKRS